MGQQAIRQCVLEQLIQETMQTQRALHQALADTQRTRLPSERFYARGASQPASRDAHQTYRRPYHHAFSKSPAELAAILMDVKEVEPQLRKSATVKIDTSEAVDAMVTRILSACGFMALI